MKLETAYKLLLLNKSAAPHYITMLYKELMKKYHPDRWESKRDEYKDGYVDMMLSIAQVINEAKVVLDKEHSESGCNFPRRCDDIVRLVPTIENNILDYIEEQKFFLNPAEAFNTCCYRDQYKLRAVNRVLHTKMSEAEAGGLSIANTDDFINMISVIEIQYLDKSNTWKHLSIVDLLKNFREFILNLNDSITSVDNLKKLKEIRSSVERNKSYIIADSDNTRIYVKDFLKTLFLKSDFGSINDVDIYVPTDTIYHIFQVEGLDLANLIDDVECEVIPVDSKSEIKRVPEQVRLGKFNIELATTVIPKKELFFSYLNDLGVVVDAHDKKSLISLIDAYVLSSKADADDIEIEFNND